MSTAFLDITL